MKPLFSQKVNSKPYELMLNAMLNKKDLFIDVENAAKAKDILFLDAREKNEFEVSHIKKAKYLGYDQPDYAALENIDKNTAIIVYCSVGYRSEKMSEKLIDMGFKNVKNLYGGIFEWVNQGHKVVDPKGNDTEKIHAYNLVWGVWLNKGKKVYE